MVAFADQGHFFRQFPPDADAQHFPELDVLEFGEEGSLAQPFEVSQILLRLIFLLHLVAHCRQILGELGAIAVAAVEIFSSAFLMIGSRPGGKFGLSAQTEGESMLTIL
jgi:hypothetical protein